MKGFIKSSEIVLDKKDLWKLITSCRIPFDLGNENIHVDWYDEQPIEDDGYNCYSFHWNEKFIYGKYWAVEYMWKLYVCLQTFKSFTWKDVDGIEDEKEVDIMLPVKVLGELPPPEGWGLLDKEN